MYASVLEVTFKPSGAEPAVAAFKEQVAPAFKSVEGFRHYYGVQTGPDMAVTMLIFDTQEHAEAGVQRLLPLVQEAMGSHIARMDRRWGELVVNISG